MSRVFVVQNQHRWDRDKQRFEPKFNLAHAEEFGELVYLLSPTAAPFRPEPIIDELKEKLADFGPGDHLLLVGNPVLIGFAVAIAADANDGDVWPVCQEPLIAPARGAWWPGCCRRRRR